ncbi:MAG: SCO family protein [Bryobacteraceae bacterium]
MRLWLVFAAVAVCGCGRRYRIEGLVLEARPEKREMVVSHRAIPGVMPAMAMPFAVPSGAPMPAPGAAVSFDLRIARGHSRVSKFRVADAAAAQIDDMRLPLPSERTAIGDPVPDFALTDQQSQPVRLSQFRGRVVLVNFLYTRCPLPEVCPRLAASFASLQRRFAAGIPDRLTLLSISLDPTYDSPEVLQRYARQSGARYPGWRMLTGDTAQVARKFGLIHWPEEGVIVHTSRTAVIDADGRLRAVVDGSSFRFEQLADLVRHSLR